MAAREDAVAGEAEVEGEAWPVAAVWVAERATSPCEPSVPGDPATVVFGDEVGSTVADTWAEPWPASTLTVPPVPVEPPELTEPPALTEVPCPPPALAEALAWIEVEAEPPLPPVAVALPPVAETFVLAVTDPVAEWTGALAVALPPTATAGPPLPPDALPLLTDTWALAETPEVAFPVVAEPPLPPVAVALPPVAETLTFTAGAAGAAGAAAGAGVGVGAVELALAPPPDAVAGPPLAPDAFPLLTETLTEIGGLEETAGDAEAGAADAGALAAEPSAGADAHAAPGSASPAATTAQLTPARRGRLIPRIVCERTSLIKLTKVVYRPQTLTKTPKSRKLPFRVGQTTPSSRYWPT